MSKLKDLEWLFNGRHFDLAVIVLCVRWYLRYLVEMMAERGVSLAHTTILRSVQRCKPEFVERAGRRTRSGLVHCRARASSQMLRCLEGRRDVLSISTPCSIGPCELPRFWQRSVQR